MSHAELMADTADEYHDNSASAKSARLNISNSRPNTVTLPSMSEAEVIDEETILNDGDRDGSEDDEGTKIAIIDRRQAVVSAHSPDIALKILQQQDYVHPFVSAMATTTSDHDNCSHCTGIHREYVMPSILPKSKPNSSHRRWQHYINHIRQPGNSLGTYWHFRVCISRSEDHKNCSPYSYVSCSSRDFGPIKSHFGYLFAELVGRDVYRNRHVRMTGCLIDKAQLFKTSHDHPMYDAAVCNLNNLAADAQMLHLLLQHGTNALSRPTGFSALLIPASNQLVRFMSPDGHHLPVTIEQTSFEGPHEDAQSATFSDYAGPIMRAIKPVVAQAAAEGASMAKKIFQDYGLVQQLIARHEASMQGAWSRKSSRQRRMLLQRAADLHPDGLWESSKLPDGHRAEVEIGLHDCKNMPRDPLNVPMFAVPHLNLTDLSEGHNLLLFIKSRGRNSPGVFANQDLTNCGVMHRQIMHKGQGRNPENECGNTSRPSFPEVPGYVMQLTGAETAQEYAKLHHENELSSIGGLEVEVGLSIMKIQILIYSLLHRICLVLLDCSALPQVGDVRKQQTWWLDDAVFPEQPEPAILDLTMSLPSVPKMLRSAAYKVPTRIDLDHLESLVSARAREARDDLIAMRSDPSLFQHMINAESDHSPLHIEDHHRQTSEDVADGTGSEFYWMRVLETVIRNKHLDLALWSGVLKHLVKLKELWPSGESATDQPLSLFPELHKVFCQLHGLLRIAADYAVKEMALASYTPFRHVWSVHEHIGECDDLFLDRKFLNDHPGVRLAKTFLFISMEPAGRRHSSDWVLADYMQSLMHDDPNESKFMTDLLASRFNDWALLEEVNRQLSGLHVWSQNIGEGTFLFSKDIINDLEVLHRFNKVAFGAAQTVAESNFLRHNRFKYPSDAVRSRQVVETRREAEEQLQIFWSKVDDYCANNFVPIEEMLGVDFMDEVVPRTTAAWSEAEEEAAAVRHQASPGRAVDLLDLELRTRLTIDTSNPVCPKAKLKTKGDGAATTLQPPLVEPNPSPQSRGPPDGSIRLGKKAYRTLTTLFHSAEEQANRPREILWNDFAYAMVAVGFSVKQLWGSAWHFQPLDPSIGRSIQFHEPHPSHTMGLILSRHIGRRLNRAFGWKFETFARKAGTEQV